MRSKVFAVIVVAALVASGCTGVRTPGERQARANLEKVGSVYRPNGQMSPLPALNPDAGLATYLQYSMLNQPSIAEAYYKWAASVERITVERSKPDPQFTFQADISDAVMSVMPGLMQMIPGPGKLKAAAKVADAESHAAYFAFETAVLRSALALKQAYYQLWLLDEKIRINRETLALLSRLEISARAQNEVGRVTLQDVYRAQIEQDKLRTEIANLEDSKRALMAQFKAALGMTRDQQDPPAPTKFESTSLNLNGNELLDIAFARSPRLRAMEAEIRIAEASVAVAAKSKIPDFSLGVMAETKANPAFARPLATVTLPIWRDKIAAQIAGAQANKHAAEARLTAEQIMVTVDFAMKSYDYREVTRNLQLLHDTLISKARRSLEIARAGYLGGQIDFFNLIDAQRTLLNFQLEEAEARMRREITLAELSLNIAGITPEGAPTLRATTNTK
ncbi:MAG: TolC family protein [Limisphaerales bacterium]